jgi:hypothetical protein
VARKLLFKCDRIFRLTELGDILDLRIVTVLIFNILFRIVKAFNICMVNYLAAFNLVHGALTPNWHFGGTISGGLFTHLQR